MRNIPFEKGGHYHIYNRGVDKRNIFEDSFDLERFFESIKVFNSIEPVGSIYENSFVKDKRSETRQKTLVKFIAYCINPNHYHFLIEQNAEKGVEMFMHRLGTGYTKYFNNKHKRSGSLFQGKFKASVVDSNEYLLHLSAYINLNHRAHQLGSRASKLVGEVSSWEEYIGKPSAERICDTDIVLGQFKNSKEYRVFAESSLEDIFERKERAKELEDLVEIV